MSPSPSQLPDYTVLNHGFVPLEVLITKHAPPAPVIQGKKFVVMLLMVAALAVTVPASVHAESDTDMSEKVQFGATLEEVLGHFKALEDNLDESNAGLAMAHATHPVAELYDLIKPTLAAVDPALDSEVRETLTGLADATSTRVDRDEAQAAIDNAKDVVEKARAAVIEPELSGSHTFKLKTMAPLMETAAVEYVVAVSNGTISEMAEFQDGAAFVWRSEQILDTIRDDLGREDYEKMKEIFGEINGAYAQRADPSVVKEQTSLLIGEINAILGVSEDEGDDLQRYVENIRNLLSDARTEYEAGNTDLALSHATRAYLDNYEFLEGPLIEAGERELMEEIEGMMRNELRAMMKEGAPASEISEQIDAILLKMEVVSAIVPEFDAMPAIVIAVGATAVITFASRGRLVPLLARLPSRPSAAGPTR